MPCLELGFFMPQKPIPDQAYQLLHAKISVISGNWRISFQKTHDDLLSSRHLS